MNIKPEENSALEKLRNWLYHQNLAKLEQIQRKSRVRERTPQNAPRIRAGVEKKDQKAELKK